MEPTPHQPVKAPEPGIYPGVVAEEYHKWAALNASTLKNVRISLRHTKAYMNDEYKPPSGAARLGTALHAHILEPERFRKQYLRLESIKNPKTGRPNKLSKDQTGEIWDIVAQEHPGRVVLSKDMTRHMIRMRRGAHREKPAWDVLQGPGINEVAIIWENNVGILCKALIDRVKWGKDEHEAVDIKTTRNIGIDDFGRDFWSLGYAIQVPHYKKALTAAAQWDKRFAVVTHFSLLVIENVVPHDCVLYNMDEENTASVMNRLYSEVSQRFAYGWSHDTWPGVSCGDIVPVAIPGWAMARYMEGG